MSPAREENPRRAEVDRFILDEVESVPHMEALLILWNSRPKRLPLQELAALLYLPEEQTRAILEDLEQRTLVERDAEGIAYSPGHPRDHLMGEVDRTWRRELVRLSKMIHSKGSPAVREFARAFRFKKN